MEGLAATRKQLEEADLPDDLRVTCLQITGAIETLDHDRGQFLPMSYFFERVGVGGPAELQRLVTALGYVTTMRCSPLAAHAYIVDCGNVVELDAAEFRHVLLKGELVHPRTGEVLEDAERHVRMFYSLRRQPCD